MAHTLKSQFKTYRMGVWRPGVLVNVDGESRDWKRGRKGQGEGREIGNQASSLENYLQKTQRHLVVQVDSLTLFLSVPGPKSTTTISAVTLEGSSMAS